MGFVLVLVLFLTLFGLRIRLIDGTLVANARLLNETQRKINIFPILLYSLVENCIQYSRRTFVNIHFLKH